MSIGIIQKNARERLVILQPTSISDGKETFSQTECYGFSSSLKSIDYREFGSTIRDGRVFYLSPLTPTPTIPGSILDGGRKWVIRSVKILKKLSGEVIGFRVVAGE